MLDCLVPLILFSVTAMAMGRGKNAYGILTEGAADGLKLLASLAPGLVLLLSAVSMLRTSGAMEAISRWTGPWLSRVGIPPETAMLILIRPVSGSAALALGADLMKQYGVDSLIGRTAAVMLGSTETTFYAMSIYFGAAGIRKTRYTLPAALIADWVGFLAAAWTARWTA